VHAPNFSFHHPSPNLTDNDKTGSFFFFLTSEGGAEVGAWPLERADDGGLEASRKVQARLKTSWLLACERGARGAGDTSFFV
jgi:hypothetical protein